MGWTSWEGESNNWRVAGVTIYIGQRNMISDSALDNGVLFMWQRISKLLSLCTTLASSIQVLFPKPAEQILSIFLHPVILYGNGSQIVFPRVLRKHDFLWQVTKIPTAKHRNPGIKVGFLQLPRVVSVTNVWQSKPKFEGHQCQSTIWTSSINFHGHNPSISRREFLSCWCTSITN
jgi:hypothetical protein